MAGQRTNRNFTARNMMTTSAIMTAGLMVFSGPAAADANNPWADIEAVRGSISKDLSISNINSITQHSDRAVTKASSADIMQNQTVNIQQNGSGSLFVLRTTGADADGAQLLGALNANGRVLILDRNGVFFGADSRIDVGGIVASTGDVDDDAVMNGDRVLTLKNFGDGSVINEGRITVNGAGLAALVAPQVINNGIIEAKLGKVALASGGESATVDLYGDGLVQIVVGGAKGKALVENNGRVEGATVLMTAEAAKGMVDTVINMKGVVKATTASVQGGKIILGGGSAGVVKVSGTLDASGKNGGGSISINGENVLVDETGAIDVSAVETDNGGTVTLWANRNAIFFGNIFARGGSTGGNGGSVEVSGADNVAYSGLVDTSAANGETGHFLLDPKNINIGYYDFGAIVTAADVLADVFAAGNKTLVRLDAQALANTLKYSDIDLWATETINTVGTKDIDLSTWKGLFGSKGITANDLTLSAPTINLSNNIILGNGGLYVYDIAAGVSPLGLGFIPAPYDIAVDTLNLNGKVMTRSTVGGATMLATTGQIGGEAVTINVLSDAASINQGIAFADNGATVNVAAGTYAESVLVNKSVTLLGNNHGIDGDASRLAESTVTPNSPGFHVTADGVTVDGFAISGADNGVLVDSGADGAIILNNVITGSTARGIYVSRGNGVTITGNTIYAPSTDGIDVSKNAGLVVVTSNTIYSAGDEGIEVHGSQADGSGDITIEDNNIYNADDDGIQVQYATGYTSIARNHIEGTGSDGIEARDFTNLSVVDNYVTFTRDEGIEASADNTQQGSYALIARNALLFNGTDGVMVQNIYQSDILNNIIALSDDSGIDVVGGYSTTISNNFVAASGDDGILVVGAGNPYFETNGSIEGNGTIWPVSILGNRVVLSGRNGVAVYETGASDISNNQIALSGTNYEDWLDALFGEEGKGEVEYDLNTLTVLEEEIPAYDLVLNWGDGDGIHAEYVFRYEGQGENNNTQDSKISVFEEGESEEFTPQPALNITNNSVWWSGGDGIDARYVGSAYIGYNIVTTSGVESTSFYLGNLDFEQLMSDAEDVVYGSDDMISFLSTLIPAPALTVFDNHDGIHVEQVYGDDDFGGYEFASFGEMTDTDYAVRIIGNTVDNTGGDGIEVANSGWSHIGSNNVSDTGLQFVENSGSGEKTGNQESENTEQPLVFLEDYEEATGHGIYVHRETLFEGKGYGSSDGAVGLIDYNTVINAGENGIDVSNVNNLLIDHNTVTGSAEDGINVEGGPGYYLPAYLEGGEGEGYWTWDWYRPDFNATISNNGLDDNHGSGVVVADITNTVVNGNIISNSGANGLFVAGPKNDSVVLFENRFNSNPIGALFESGAIDLTGPANFFTGGNEGMVFRPYAIEGEGTSYADMSLVNNTIGETTFEGQSGYYIELANGAFFAPGTPTILDALNATFDGVRPSLSGGVLTNDEYDAIEEKIFHFIDDTSLGLFFFGVAQDELPEIAEEDAYNTYGGFAGAAGRFRITILGLPKLPGSGNGGGTAGGTIADFLANITPAAGGEGTGGGTGSETNPESIEPAAGGGTTPPAGNTGQPTDASCWSQAAAEAGSGVAVSYSFGSDPEEALSQAASCGASS